MNLEKHVEKLRIEVAFPKKGPYGASAIIYMHISVIRFFKTLTNEQIEKIQNRLVAAGKQYFGDEAEFSCRVYIDEEYGLRSWNSPGNACGFDPEHYEWKHMRDEDKEWITYLPHNTDRPEQLMYLIAVACWFRDLAEAVEAQN